MRTRFFLGGAAAALLVLTVRPVVAAGDVWTLFPNPGQTPRDQLRQQLNREGKRRLGERASAVSAIRTQAEAEARQKEVREKILRLMGGLPTQKPPLNTRNIGVEERGDYKFEKIIYESLPGFYVPANVYLPSRGSGPFPAILMPVGHSPEGKEGERATAIGLARKGFVVLKYDPIGQGERLQYYDPDLRASKVGSSTQEHSHANGHSVLIGDNVARYRVWDGIRGIDYLISRRDVDPNRIGITGCSGGGTLTTYIAALDSRVQAAAPACYITSWGQLLDKLGPQDGEQSFAHFLTEGLDIADYVELFAPKPYLIASTIDDFFPLEGARQTHEEARAFYKLFQAGDRIQWFVGPGGHGVPLESREAVYEFFIKHLNNGQGDPREEVAVLDPLDKILCTKTGQVADSLGGETVYTLNRKRAAGMIPSRAAMKNAAQLDTFRSGLLNDVRKLAGIEQQPGAAPPGLTVHHSMPREGYRLELVSLEMAPGVSVTGSLAIPHGVGPHPAAVMVDPRPKEIVAAAGGDLDTSARQGFLVLAIQPRGAPEKPQGSAQNLVGDATLAYQAYLLSKSLTGLRAEDVIRSIDYLASRQDAKVDGLPAIGYGAAGVYVLHAAALDNRISHVIMQGSPALLRLGVERPIHRHIFEVAIPGMLTKYDLDDLLTAVHPRKVTVINPVDLLQRPLLLSEYRGMIARVVESDSALGSAGRVDVITRGRRDSLPLSPR